MAPVKESLFSKIAGFYSNLWAANKTSQKMFIAKACCQQAMKRSDYDGLILLKFSFLVQSLHILFAKAIFSTSQKINFFS